MAFTSDATRLFKMMKKRLLQFLLLSAAVSIFAGDMAWDSLHPQISTNGAFEPAAVIQAKSASSLAVLTEQSAVSTNLLQTLADQCGVTTNQLVSAIGHLLSITNQLDSTLTAVAGVEAEIMAGNTRLDAITNQVGAVALNTGTAYRQRITLTVDQANAMADGDILAKLVGLRNVAKADGGSASIHNISVVSGINVQTPMTVVLFDRPPTLTLTNTVSIISALDLQNVVGAFQIDITDFIDLGTNFVASKQISYLPFTPAGTDVYIGCIANGTYKCTNAPILSVSFNQGYGVNDGSVFRLHTSTTGGTFDPSFTLSTGSVIADMDDGSVPISGPSFSHVYTLAGTKSASFTLLAANVTAIDANTDGLIGLIPDPSLYTALTTFDVSTNALVGAVPSLTSNPSLVTVSFAANPGVSGYTASTLSTNITAFYGNDTGLTQAAVDQILADFIAAPYTAMNTNCIISLDGTGPAAPSSTNDVFTLTSYGMTVTTN